MEYINIGPAPWNEDCVQVGSDDYARRARIECAAFREAIRKKLGNEPAGASLMIRSFSHDFGSYMEVVCYYDDSEAAFEYAMRCESESPGSWAEVGMTNPLEGVPNEKI